MQLPEITLPKVELPFDVPVLLHAPVDHFAMALPVVILLLELLNLFLKERAISGLSFFLIFITVGVTVAAYFTGLVDGKEAYPALSEAAKETLREHKTLGTYLMLGTGVLLFFKLLSMLTGKGIMKALYLLLLIVYVVGIFEQGKEGGELVYKYGANVEQVKTLDDKIFDLEEALEEAVEKTEVSTEVEKSETVNLPTPTQSIKTPVETTPIETLSETLKTNVQEVIVPAVQEKVETLQVEGMPEEMVQPEIATH